MINEKTFFSLGVLSESTKRGIYYPDFNFLKKNIPSECTLTPSECQSVVDTISVEITDIIFHNLVFYPDINFSSNISSLLLTKNDSYIDITGDPKVYEKMILNDIKTCGLISKTYVRKKITRFLILRIIRYNKWQTLVSLHRRMLFEKFGL